MDLETVFTYGAPQLKFGWGAVDEVGYDVRQLGGRRVLLVTDAGVAASGASGRAADSVTAYGGEVVLYDRVHVEPTDRSLEDAVDAARSAGPFDVVLAVGGGSSIDTGKAVALLTSCPGELMDYVNPPVGAGRAPEGPLTPLVAVPTTTGTGSEATTVCVLDVVSRHLKTGISHARLRPVLAVVDPSLTMTQPREVTAASGLDVLCHALESWTARPFDAFERRRPEQRVPYCGANPVSDVWVERSLGLLSRSFVTAVTEPERRDARCDMALAATLAGMGFGNAGVHVPHAGAYPVAGAVRDFHAPGYPGDAPFVPHGVAVALTAPEAFRFTFEADPGRHLRAAEILADGRGEYGDHEPEGRLPGVLSRLLDGVGAPAGLAALGLTAADVPVLVDGALQQERLLATSPRDVHADDLAGIFTRSLERR